MPKADHQNQTEGFENKNEITLNKVIVFNRHICAINTAKYKESSSFGFWDISYQTYPVQALQTSNITTRLHCYLTIAAAFHKLTGLVERRNRQNFMFQEKSTLFCQIEIFKLLTLCCSVNAQHACNIFHFSQSVQKLSIYPVTNFSVFNRCDLFLEDWFFCFKVFLKSIMKQRKQMFWTSRLQQTVFVLMYTF